ncbi:unnamed protein product [Linum trigynum]|uniref:Uncharacterized protein n=1 Tax=Linum trigynum TaxID=586398 RepID=A0AAV2GNS8_9ROSI
MQHREKETASCKLPPSSGISPSAGPNVVPRRRRLILEEESEDEFFVQPISSSRQGAVRPAPRQSDPCVQTATQAPKRQVASKSQLKGKVNVELGRPGPK